MMKQQRYTSLNIATLAFATLTLGIGSFTCADSPVGVETLPEVIRYEDFGAKGDGVTDDMDAIRKAHAYANKHGLPVHANDKATYYIGGKRLTARIQTNTDFGSAKFIIDDTSVEQRYTHVFEIKSNKKSFSLDNITSLKRNQSRLKVDLSEPCLVRVVNANVKQFIRFGPNKNKGSSQTDVFLVNQKGKVDRKTPIFWDFDEITKITARPLDETQLTVKGGHFTTIANSDDMKDGYFWRGLAVNRSNVVVDGIEHHVRGEGERGAPYYGFINIANCANITVKNCLFTGHKTYSSIGASGSRVSKGTYDFTATEAINVSFINCHQTNDINDNKYWGIMASNFCKNLLYDNCVLSRFDAHQGVVNATILNSTLGYMGINAIGGGTLTVKDTTIFGNHLAYLRKDYGSTWRGEFLFRDCVFVPGAGKSMTASLIGGYNPGQHDFGYTCYMPSKITIHNLQIDDSKHPKNYRGPAIFANFNRDFKDASYQEAYPYIKTKRVTVKNVTTASGEPLRLSSNPYMFNDVVVKESK